MQYSSFTPLPPTQQQIKTQKEYHEKKLKELQEIIKEKELIKLENDYLNASDYYYNSKNNQLYEYIYTRYIWQKPNYDVEQHIRKLNKLI